MLCRDKRGLIPWGIQDSQLPGGGEEARASVVFRVVSVEGSGFNPEALKCGPRVVRSHLAVLWKGVTEGDRQMWRSMGGRSMGGGPR